MNAVAMKMQAQLSCFREHNWLMTQAIAFLDLPLRSCPGHNSWGLHQANDFANGLMNTDLFLQTQDLFSGILWLEDSLSACANFLELHCSLKHLIHVAPSFSLSFRDIRPTVKDFFTVSSSLLFFFFPHRYMSPINLLHFVEGYILIFWYSKISVHNPWNL